MCSFQTRRKVEFWQNYIQNQGDTSFGERLGGGGGDFHRGAEDQQNLPEGSELDW